MDSKKLSKYASLMEIKYAYYGGFNVLEIEKIDELYNEFLQNYALLIKKLNYTHPYQIFALFNYMLFHGYLSYEQVFKCSSEDARDIICCNRYLLSGTSIIYGEGVCRHASSMLKDTYTTLGYDAYLLPTYCNYEKSFVGYFLGNHALVLVTIGNKNYVLDPINECNYYIDHGLLTTRKKTFKCRMIKRDYAFQGNDEEYQKGLNLLFCEQRRVINNKENKIIDATTRECMHNEEVMHKFYQDNQGLYQEMQRILKKRKSYY